MSVFSGPPITKSISFFHDFGEGDGSFAFKGQKGMEGELIDVEVIATENFSNVDSPASVKVGTAGDDDHYASLGLGELSAGDHLSASETTDALIITDPLPADTLIVVTLVAPTGADPAPTGKAIVNITTAWSY